MAVDGGADALARSRAHARVAGGRPGLHHLPRPLGISKSRGVEVLVLPTAKDETDTEAALRMVVDRGATDITVFKALGGPRLDHLVGNLLLLAAPWLAQVRVRWWMVCTRRSW